MGAPSKSALFEPHVPSEVRPAKHDQWRSWRVAKRYVLQRASPFQSHSGNTAWKGSEGEGLEYLQNLAPCCPLCGYATAWRMLPGLSSGAAQGLHLLL